MEYLPTFTDQLDSDYISHHGVKGMRWGIRRYQNYDGTYKKKAKIGSIGRVRQKQQVIKSKINSDGILGKGDTNFIRRTIVNDYRRGRVKQLENKARNREAIREFKINKTTANAKKVGITAAKRLGSNMLAPGMIGTYDRNRNLLGRSRLHSGYLAVAPYIGPISAPATIGTMAGEALVDRFGTRTPYKENRRKYAKRTKQTSRL